MKTIKGFLFAFTRIVIKIINGYVVFVLVNVINTIKQIKIIFWTSYNSKSLLRGNNRNMMIHIKMKHSISNILLKNCSNS